MSMRSTSTSDLLAQFNAVMARKYRNPPVVIVDPLIGAIVKHGNWKYITNSLTDAFSVGCAWGKRERPKSEPLPKTSLLEICSNFLTHLNAIKEHGATKEEVSSAARFINKHLPQEMAATP